MLNVHCPGVAREYQQVVAYMTTGLETLGDGLSKTDICHDEYPSPFCSVRLISTTCTERHL
jgi:hypothetical protein